MASENKEAGFLINQSRIALALSIITLLGIAYQGSKLVLDNHYRISALEVRWIEMSTTQRELTTEVRDLTRTIHELNLTIREVQIRQQGNGQ